MVFLEEIKKTLFCCAEIIIIFYHFNSAYEGMVCTSQQLELLTDFKRGSVLLLSHQVSF